MQGFRIIPNIFFPPSDKAIFTATYELPAGTSIERTMEVVETVDRFIDAELRAGAGEAAEGVTNWATFAGNGGPRFYLAHNPEPHNPQFAFSLLNATSRDVAISLQDRAQRLRDHAVPRGGDQHRGDAPLDAGEPHRRDEARQPQRLRPGDGRGGASAAGSWTPRWSGSRRPSAAATGSRR